jgi:hypothetical protein
MSRIGAGTSGLEIDASDTAHFKASGQVAIGVNGADNKEGIHVIGSPTTSQSLGVKIDAGTNTSDSALLVRSQNGGTTYLNIRGDGAVAFTGMFGLAQATGPTIANGNNNNITISGVVNGLTAPSGNGDITGIAGGYEGRVLFLLVYSTLGGAVRLSNEDANSTAANRITIMAGGSAAAFNFAILVYNGATSRWRAYVIT